MGGSRKEVTKLTVLGRCLHVDDLETFCNGKNIRLLTTALTNMIQTGLKSNCYHLLREDLPNCMVLPGFSYPTLCLKNVYKVRGLNFLNSMQSTYVVWVLFVFMVAKYVI